ncbi:MAG: hypothetical protein A2V72_02295 [Candidatus Nealsonbacteria bacterium RBG_13_37_56]|uniref:Uncharacterized protein n=1 Tax=Candidatus Nealsonbacteria bacterium RBG_13_37_56 TaxID=1801661 RepID=A0A1G2DVL1_9BACT|nr:MAG: hypothetical protein A2V72_02295 [Candidatus Nealsonbacteria bacterium RBG_13_37_56]
MAVPQILGRVSFSFPSQEKSWICYPALFILGLTSGFVSIIIEISVIIFIRNRNLCLKKR